VAATLERRASVSAVARSAGIHASQLYSWRRRCPRGGDQLHRHAPLCRVHDYAEHKPDRQHGRRRLISSDTRRPAARARCNIARSRNLNFVRGSGALSSACISSRVKYPINASSIFFIEIAWIRRDWSRHEGSRYSRNRKKELMAANRALRVAEFRVPAVALDVLQEALKLARPYL
jgi:transposase-like protein